MTAYRLPLNLLSTKSGETHNDGYLDLYVSHLGPGTPIPRGAPLNPRVNFLYRNSGPPSYTLAPVQDDALTTTRNMTWTSSWSDYDNDGDLDVFVPTSGGPHLLYRNEVGTKPWKSSENR